MHPRLSITIETDDCRKTVEELKSRGVEFVSDVLEFPSAISRSAVRTRFARKRGLLPPPQFARKAPARCAVP